MDRVFTKLKSRISSLECMINVYVRRPEWFLGADASLELLAAVIALFVAFASYRVYKLTSGKKYLAFMLSFALMTLSFLSRSVTDFILEELFFTVPNSIAGNIFFAGYLGHIFLALLSYLLLISITLDIKDKKLIYLLGLILIPSMLISASYYLSFYGLSLILLAFITHSYWRNYKKVCKGSACMVFVGFALLTLAQAFFLLDTINANFYVIAHLSQAAGFISLLVTLIKTLK